MLSNHWVSWHHYVEMGDFNSDLSRVPFPCWFRENDYIRIDNEIVKKYTYFAAIQIDSERGFNSVRDRIVAGYEAPVGFIDFRFMILKPKDWSPFCDKYPREDWMVWHD